MQILMMLLCHSHTGELRKKMYTQTKPERLLFQEEPTKIGIDLNRKGNWYT